jgi:hypothetical protein
VPSAFLKDTFLAQGAPLMCNKTPSFAESIHYLAKQRNFLFTGYFNTELK